MNEDAYSSPPCFACEMDEAYAGYLPAAELATMLTRLAALAEAAAPPAREDWGKVLRTLIEMLGGSSTQIVAARVAPESALDALRHETVALLPRIADNRIHAPLKRLIDAGPGNALDGKAV